MKTSVNIIETYGSILARLSTATLECDAVTLVLETLSSDETLDARSLGVRLRSLFLWLYFTANDILAHL